MPEFAFLLIIKSLLNSPKVVQKVLEDLKKMLKRCYYEIYKLSYTYFVLLLEYLPTPFPSIHERSEVNDEMARDEARHGKALKGLLERYFG